MQNTPAPIIDAFADFDRLPADALIPLPVLQRLLTISRPTIYRHLDRGILPSPRKIGGRILWRVGDLRAFLQGGAEE